MEEEYSIVDMDCNPRNRYVTLIPHESPNDDHDESISKVLLPEGYEHKKCLYGVYHLDNISPDCVQVSADDINKLVVVNESMIETIDIYQGEYWLIQENHIYGVLNDIE